MSAEAGKRPQETKKTSSPRLFQQKTDSKSRNHLRSSRRYRITHLRRGSLDWAWISDESSLWDFHTDDTNEKLWAKILEVYGVDVSDIESARLSEILNRIAATGWSADGVPGK